MMSKPTCRKRNCVHYLGIRQDNEQEETERVVCTAFPDKIPDEIAYGPNLHLKAFPGDHGIVYERAT